MNRTRNTLEDMILSRDQLIVDQVTSFVTNDFAIRDIQGNPIGGVVTEGGLGANLFLGNREFSIVDYETGTVAARIVDVMNLWKDTYQVLSPQGHLLVDIIKEITFFHTKLTLAMFDGTRLAVNGNFFEFEFQVHGPRGMVATISRSWDGAVNYLIGRERYVLSFAYGTPLVVRQGILGAAVAVDLIRAKDRR